MDPNSQSPTPTEQPRTDAMPDSIEPDTATAAPMQPEQAAPTLNDVPPVTNSVPPVPVTPPLTTPLPSSDSVVNPTTQTTTPTTAIGSVAPKNKTRLILVIILLVVVLAVAGILIYVTTKK